MAKKVRGVGVAPLRLGVRCRSSGRSYERSVMPSSLSLFGLSLSLSLLYALRFREAG